MTRRTKGVFGSLSAESLEAKHVRLTHPNWDDLRFPVQALRIPSGVAAPGWTQLRGCEVLAFDASTTEYIDFVAQMPHDRQSGSDIDVHAHWTAGSVTTTGTVVWGFQYTWGNINGTFPTPTTVYVTDQAEGVRHKHLMANIGTVTGTNKSLSSILMCRFFRNAASSTDNFGTDAYLLEVDLHYRRDTLGSREELTK